MFPFLYFSKKGFQVHRTLQHTCCHSKSHPIHQLWKQAKKKLQ